MVKVLLKPLVRKAPPLCKIQSRRCLYPFRVLSIVQSRKRLPKRESKKTVTKPREILFSVKIPRWRKCKLFFRCSNLGALACGYRKQSSIPILLKCPLNSGVEPKTTRSFWWISKRQSRAGEMSQCLCVSGYQSRVVNDKTKQETSDK